MSAFQRQDSHPGNFTFPLAPSAPARREAAASPGSGWGKGAWPGRGRGVTPAHRTDLVRDPQAARNGCPCSANSAATGRPALDTVSDARLLTPAPAGEAAASGESAPVKEKAGRLRVPRGGLVSGSEPRRRAPPPHLHTARPPRFTRPAWRGPPTLICIPPAPPSSKLSKVP